MHWVHISLLNRDAEETKAERYSGLGVIQYVLTTQMLTFWGNILSNAHFTNLTFGKHFTIQFGFNPILNAKFLNIYADLLEH